jgi:hypothetical protein
MPATTCSSTGIRAARSTPPAPRSWRSIGRTKSSSKPPSAPAMCPPGTWGTMHGGRAESSPFGGIAARGGGSSLATPRPGPSNGNPSEQQGHGKRPSRSRRGATALAGAAHPAMGSRWHPPAQAHGQPGGGYSKRSLRALASPGATGLLWVGFESRRHLEWDSAIVHRNGSGARRPQPGLFWRYSPWCWPPWPSCW